MPLLQPFRSLTSTQRRAFTACFLGWTQGLGGRRRDLPYAGHAAGGSVPVWAHGRPLRAPAHADAQHHLLLGL